MCFSDGGTCKTTEDEDKDEDAVGMAGKGYVGYLLSAASNPTVQAALETTTTQ